MLQLVSSLLLLLASLPLCTDAFQQHSSTQPRRQRNQVVGNNNHDTPRRLDHILVQDTKQRGSQQHRADENGDNINDFKNPTTFSNFLSQVTTKATVSLLLAAMLSLTLSPSASWASTDEETDPSATATTSATAAATIIQSCARNEPGTPTNCVSTANVRQYDLYSPPWTYSSLIRAEEVVARLKGAIQSVYGRDLVDLTVSSDTSLFLRAQVTRNLVIPDQLEFLVNPNDHVVVFSAREVGTPRVSDFGALRQRLEQIRKTAGVFGVMGDAAQDTADGIESSYYESLKQDQSPLGQLKAFYGLQSGEGFEDVFDE